MDDDTGRLRDLSIRVRGQVQGVGFRPFVWQLAQTHGVRGQVLNDPEGVLIHGAGVPDAFLTDLRETAPPLARIDAVEATPHVFQQTPDAFLIAASDGVGAKTRVTPDAATCADCLREVRDPIDRRFGYAFANCTHCGPRFSILDRLPYDRAQTSMADFDMCADCRSEYEDPGDRRFHAQPVACPVCGPRLWCEAEGKEVATEDPIAQAADWLRAGWILAIKGIGGFHLACDATNAEAIARLRDRKRRFTKPLAVMATLDSVRQHAHLTDADEALLASPAAPIVLLQRKGAGLPDALAPGNPNLGWMQPYTPLHHLLLDAVERPLVMTSGNLSGEPQVIGNDEAQQKLARFADGFVLHNRGIRRRLDDSVERTTVHGPMVLRRGRGRVPGTLPLPPGFEDAPDVLAVGAQMKGAICLTKPGQALLSHHLGDLDTRRCFEEFRKAIADYADLFDHRPAVIACDQHPGYRATQVARDMAEADAIPLVEVQHHHAHLAACLGEHLWPRDGGAVVGIILDGLGLGSDGTIWGGEILVGDYAGFDRLAWLTPAALPGGDAANRAPWRNLLARLDRAGLSDGADRVLPDAPRDTLRQAIRQGVNAPLSSSAGRLFDAVAAALGFAGSQSFEGEAAMWLEAQAAACHANEMGDGYPFSWPGAGAAMDDAPMWRALLTDHDGGVPIRAIAHRFHLGLATACAEIARAAVADGQAQAVVLSGGCFQNAALLDLTIQALSDVPVLHHQAVPANDGSVALGQALIAAAHR